MQAMILGAGLGTRLRPLTLELPKPAMPFGDTPLFALQAAQLQSAGFSVVAMNASYLIEQLEPLANEQGIPLSRESEPLGTAGAIAHARLQGLVRVEPLLVHNGDIYTQHSWQALATDLGDVYARLAVRERSLGEGSVGWNDAGHVVRLRKVSVAPESHSGDFLGVHCLGHSAIRMCKEGGCSVGDVYIPHLIAGGRPIEIALVDAPVWDIGDPVNYHAACLAWGSGHWVSERALVQAQVRTSVVGAGARILADISGVVVWPGASVNEPLQNAIVTPTCIVHL